MHLSKLLYGFLRAFPVLAILFAGCSSSVSGEPVPEQAAEIIIGKPLRRALVSACVTHTQAESVLKAHGEKGPDAAEQAFKENGCFVLYMNLIPRSLISSRRIGTQVFSIVEIVVQTGLVSSHVIYMITPNPVVVGTRV